MKEVQQLAKNNLKVGGCQHEILRNFEENPNKKMNDFEKQ